MKNYLCIVLLFIMTLSVNVSAQDEIKPEKITNVYKNWISGELNMLGVGFRYERMLNSQWSVGANLYFQYFGILLNAAFGMDFSPRFYPSGKVFYIGLDLGLNMSFLTIPYYYPHTRYLAKNRDDPGYGNFGFAFSPGFGFKIDVGSQGGFFIDT